MLQACTLKTDDKIGANWFPPPLTTTPPSRFKHLHRQVPPRRGVQLRHGPCPGSADDERSGRVEALGVVHDGMDRAVQLWHCCGALPPPAVRFWEPNFCSICESPPPPLLKHAAGLQSCGNNRYGCNARAAAAALCQSPPLLQGTWRCRWPVVSFATALCVRCTSRPPRVCVCLIAPQ